MKSVPDPGAEPKLEEVIVELERERLFNIIRELVKWENSNNERTLNAARAEIMRRAMASRRRFMTRFVARFDSAPRPPQL